MIHFKVVVATKDEIVKHLEEIISIDRFYFGSWSWDDSHFLSDMPEKFESSILLKGPEGIMGYCMASRKEDFMHIHRFVVSPALKRRGLGYHMLEEFISKCNYREITLKVDIKNIAAIKFYCKHGFSIYGQQQDYFEMSLKLK